MPVTKDHSRHLADLMDAVVDAAQKAPWTCQVCDAAQSGPLTDGCVSCGAGTAVARKAPAEAPRAPLHGERLGWQPNYLYEKGTPQTADSAPTDGRAYESLVRWLQSHPMGNPFDAYLAGYQQAMQDAQVQPNPPSDYERLQQAGEGAFVYGPATPPEPFMDPPPSPEVGSLSPEGKASRTIRAALALFRDQVLAEQPEEILTGEWCSSDEVTDLINAYAQKE